MKQLSRSTLVWALRLTALTIIGLQVWAVLSGTASVIEVMARLVIIAGYAVTVRAPRLGGMVMLLGCAVLSIAIYAWAGMLGAYGSTLLAMHTLPPMVIGLMYMTLPLRVEPMQGAMVFEN